jgi:hypothetical protein
MDPQRVEQQKEENAQEVRIVHVEELDSYSGVICIGRFPAMPIISFKCQASMCIATLSTHVVQPWQLNAYATTVSFFGLIAYVRMRSAAALAPGLQCYKNKLCAQTMQLLQQRQQPQL